MKLNLLATACLLCNLICIQAVFADETLDEQSSVKPGLFSGVGSAVDGAHAQINSRFKSFVNQVDGFIGIEPDGEYINTSWARIRLDTIKTADGETDVKAKFKLRLVLPQSEKRFRLLLSSEDEDESIAGGDAAQQGQIEKDEENVALALRFLRKVRSQSSVKFDVGVRWRDDRAQTFGRIGAVVQKPLNEHWTVVTSNNLFHYYKSGYENRLRFDFRRLIGTSDGWYLHNATEIKWLKGNKGARIGSVAGIYVDRGPKAAYAFEALATGTTSLLEGSDDYYQSTELRLRIRRNAFRPWLFFEIWPSVNWSASNNFDRVYGGRIRIEANFGQ